MTSVRWYSSPDYWQKNWQCLDDSEYAKRLRQALQAETWVLDGNYTRMQGFKRCYVDTIIWIDYSFTRTLYQSVSRAVSRLCSKTELCPGSGNRETLKLLFSKDSILLWTLRTYFKNRKKYLALMCNPAWTHVEFIRLTSPRACERFLAGL